MTVDSVWPTYGPLAGGTRVTITGQSLNVTTVTAVYFGEYKLYPDVNRFSYPLILMMPGDTIYKLCFLFMIMIVVVSTNR